MRTLFLKIFVWFWAAMALLGTAIILFVTTMPIEPVRPPPPRGGPGNLDFQARTAALIFEREGRDALAAYFQRMGRRRPGRTFLFDAQGNDVLGRPAPPGSKQLVEHAEASGEREFEVSGSALQSARAVISPSGNRYVLLHEIPRRSRAGLLIRLLSAEPKVQILRLSIIVLASGLVCYWLARQLTSPVGKLRTATQKLARGDLSVRVGAATAGHDELAELGRDFDLMAERIESLMAAQRGLFRDVSHELRSPLARLNIALELARQRSGEAAGSALDRIEREVERLNELIGQLLSLARMESGTEGIEKESVPLSDLLREIAADADFEARNRGCSVRFVARQECTLRGNARLLRSAIENVVRNAVHHTAEKSEVELALACQDSGGNSAAVVTVSDRGPGVPKEALSNLFRPFFRVAEVPDRESGGTGLGLAITQRAVELHGGTVSAENAPGGGLRVEIRLPTAL